MAKSRVVVVLDSGALVQAGKSRKLEELVRKWREQGAEFVIPAPCLAEALRGGANDARANRIVSVVSNVVETTEAIARHAGALLAKTRLSNTIDALVVATARSRKCTDIFTSDPDDIRLLDQGSMNVVAI